MGDPLPAGGNYVQHDVFMGDHPIVIDADDNVGNRNVGRELFITSVRDEVYKVAHTKSGAILFNAIKSLHKWLRIIPTWELFYSAKNDTHRPREAAFNRDPANKRKIGSTIEFTPRVCATGTGCVKDLLARNEYIPSAQTVLFHELAHAMRDITGKIRDTNPVSGGIKDFNNEDEFYTIAVENVFNSDTGGPIRGSHLGFKKLEPYFADSVKFFELGKSAFALIDKYCTENPAFTKQIGHLHLGFNPFRTYHHDRGAAANTALCPRRLRTASQASTTA